MTEILQPLFESVAQTKQSGLRRYYAESSPEKQRFISKTTQVTEDGEDETKPVIQRPSIAFQPNWTDYLARANRLAAQRSPSEIHVLPEGFPKAITGARAWSGQDVSGLEDFVIQLTDAHIAEIESGLKYFKGMVS
jgi:hypothetical protein